MNWDVPRVQRAVQLTGPDQLRLNTAKEVYVPGPHQILCRVEVVGLCFSDLKLLQQFSGHVRKGEVVSGIEQEVLSEIPSYVPGDAATVPGHEAVVRVVAVGEKVRRVRPGGRFLVQTDYRWLRTAGANAAFGYNFEGALQEYVLMDQRVITAPEGEFMLIAVPEELSASAVALVEPWACVEDAYVVKERRRVKTNGRMLVVAEEKVNAEIFRRFLNYYGKPEQVMWVSKSSAPVGLNVLVTKAQDISQLTDAGFDDVIYFGSKVETVEALFCRVNAGGFLNIVLCGGAFGRVVTTAVGRVHYSGFRIIGTNGADPAESVRRIPATGEIRSGDRINIIGAAGPMGMMHVIRSLCQGVRGISVFAGDIDEERLAGLTKIVTPLARKNELTYRPYNPEDGLPRQEFDYVVLMVPRPNFVAESVKTVAEGAIINIFAGIPAEVSSEIDLDAYIQKRLYIVGTSGSVPADMEVVLARLQAGKLDTNLSVAAVCGLEGAIEGMRAVEKRMVSGKIMVYPGCKGLGLVRLEQFREKIPQVADALVGGVWGRHAEKILLQLYQD